MLNCHRQKQQQHLPSSSSASKQHQNVVEIFNYMCSSPNHGACYTGYGTGIHIHIFHWISYEKVHYVGTSLAFDIAEADIESKNRDHSTSLF